MSNEKFKVGDVVEILPGSADSYARKCIGKEGVIQELCVSTMLGGEPRHLVVMRDGERIHAGVSCLRKRRPPPQREATSSWDDVIVWRPKELAHV